MKIALILSTHKNKLLNQDLQRTLWRCIIADGLGKLKKENLREDFPFA